MQKLLSSKIGQLRIVGILEGSSWLILLFIAMPMKYMFNNPIGTQIMGPIHGFLFVIFVLYILLLSFQLKWSFFKITLLLLAASIIPFGTFYVDKKILSKMEMK